MDPIYVTGHRNPDTDSIVSAMAYAALRNALGDREFVAARLGHLSDETQLVLERFGFEPPVRIHNMRTQVRDLDFDVPPILSGGVTVSRAWSMLQQADGIAAVPVATDDGGLFGMLAPSDIANYDMGSITRPYVEEIPVFNLLSALEGRVVNESGCMADTVTGEVVIALPQDGQSYGFRGRNNVVLCGQQDDAVKYALEQKVCCIIVCQASVSDEMRGVSGDTCIISTPYDPYRAARMIYQSIPISRICRTHDLASFHLDDYIDDVREVVLQSRYRSYPILDENEKVVGTLSRFHLLRPRRKRVVLVDHNEASQSVPGLEQADILEIIDHHRLADIQTGAPIYFRNEPVGSTATIVASMYQERGIVPSRNMAGLIAAAIVSDTVMFKSPTCTHQDVRMAERMARIGELSLEELGRDMFSISANMEKSAEELFFTDFKEFHIAGHDLGISQITCLDSETLKSRSDEFLELMRRVMQERGYAITMLMLTDVLREGTELLFVGDEDDVKLAFNVEPHDNSVFLPKIVSRKKQIIPMLSVLWG